MRQTGTHDRPRSKSNRTSASSKEVFAWLTFIPPWLGPRKRRYYDGCCLAWLPECQPPSPSLSMPLGSIRNPPTGSLLQGIECASARASNGRRRLRVSSWLRVRVCVNDFLHQFSFVDWTRALAVRSIKVPCLYRWQRGRGRHGICNVCDGLSRPSRLAPLCCSG